jgi:hypothetical protein
MSRTRKPHDAEEVRRLGETTIAFYDRFARAFWLPPIAPPLRLDRSASSIGR